MLNLILSAPGIDVTVQDAKGVLTLHVWGFAIGNRTRAGGLEGDATDVLSQRGFDRCLVLMAE
jgi:hypothetical protein